MKVCKECLDNFNEPYEVEKCYMDEKDILFYECPKCGSITDKPLILILEVDTNGENKAGCSRNPETDSVGV